MYQTTIARSFSCSGTGLHSGNRVHLSVRPGSENTGIVFEVTTISGIKRLELNPEQVISTGLATTIGCAEVKISTVEHLLATIRGLNIDNLVISIEGHEVPILDGSAAEWVRLFSQAGIVKQKALRKVLRFVRPFEYSENNKYIKAMPYDGFAVECTIDFPHPSIGKQHLEIDLTPSNFTQVSRARTFGFLKDVEYLRKNGLALGGSLDNAVVLNENGVMNEGGLRFENECVRHKVLDFVGDMAMLPYALQGRFQTFCSGHDLNNKFLRQALKAGALQLVELSETKANLKKSSPACGAWVAA